MPDDLLTIPRNQLADALRRGADGADMRAAVEMLTGYNDGDLLDADEIRRHIATWDRTAGTARVLWSDLYDELTGVDGGDGGDLSETAYRAALLACALKAPVPLPSLARTLATFDENNSRVALRAFAIALGVDREPDTVTLSPQHLAERIVSILNLAPHGLTAEQLTDQLTDGGIKADRLTVTAALGMIAAAHPELVQPEPHGPYYWRH